MESKDCFVFKGKNGTQVQFFRDHKNHSLRVHGPFTPTPDPTIVGEVKGRDIDFRVNKEVFRIERPVEKPLTPADMTPLCELMCPYGWRAGKAKFAK